MDNLFNNALQRLAEHNKNKATGKQDNFDKLIAELQTPPAFKFPDAPTQNTDTEAIPIWEEKTQHLEDLSVMPTPAKDTEALVPIISPYRMKFSCVFVDITNACMEHIKKHGYQPYAIIIDRSDLPALSVDLMRLNGKNNFFYFNNTSINIYTEAEAPQWLKRALPGPIRAGTIYTIS